MKTLVLAEKPSVGQALARVLKATGRGEGYLEGERYIVSWCVGHLVQLAAADSYDGKYSTWSLEDLPIVPEEWNYIVPATAAKQFEIIKELMERQDVESLVCATDAGREGELIFRLVYEQAGCEKPFRRLWISSLEDEAIRSGFADLKMGAEYDDLYHAALCRAKADWLVGINATRLFTLVHGGRRTLNVGRVMTPTLAFLVEREQEIKDFKKEKFYTVELDCGGFSVASGRVRSKTDAEKLRVACLGKPVLVKSVRRQEKTERAPKLYDLTALQREANRIYGYTAQQTLDYLQALYEKRLATYPRTDSRYLTSDMAEGLPKLCDTVAGAFPFASEYRGEMAAEQVIDDAKVSDHHAILPTEGVARVKLNELPGGERGILSLLAARLLCAVCPEKFVYAETEAVLECCGTEFSLKGREVLSEGWRAMENAFMVSVRKKEAGRRLGPAEPEPAAEKLAVSGQDKEQTVPELAEGQTLTAESAALKEGTTKPPQRYTEDTLLGKMERAGTDEMNEDVERRGIGTPATRAETIEKIVRCGFALRDKKQIFPTEDGMKLIGILPEVLKSAGLSADWENKLALIAKGEYGQEVFMEEIVHIVQELVGEYGQVSESSVFAAAGKEKEVLGSCPVCGKNVAAGKYGPYCEGKCGIGFRKVRGQELSESQVKALLNGKKLLMKGLKSKEGKTYDAYFVPDGYEDYTYNGKRGYKLKVRLEFPQKTDRG